MGYGLWWDENVFTVLLLAGFRWDVGYGLAKLTMTSFTPAL